MTVMSAGVRDQREPMRRGGRPSTCKIEERDRELLDVAEHVFLCNGYHNVSLALIARTANVAVRTIYERYGDKRGLLGKIIERRRDEDISRLNGLAAEQAGAEESLFKLAEHAFNHMLCSKARLIHSDALAERDFVLASDSHAIGWGQWREIVKRNLADDSWRKLCTLTSDTEALVDLFLGCIFNEYFAGTYPGHYRELSETDPDARARIATERFIRTVTQTAPDLHL